MLPGIDVSVYQGVIDWHKVHQSGIDFAGIKATEALYNPDAQFARNWNRSKLRGCRRIAYHFFHADIAGAAQADHFHQTVHDAGHFQAGDCAMLDIEETNGQPTAQLVATAEAFVERFLATTECGLYIYTGPWFWQSVLGNPKSSILAKCPLWIATWGSTPGHIDNWPSGPAIWQWSDGQTVPGITGGVDADRFLGTLTEYDTLARWGGRK